MGREEGNVARSNKSKNRKVVHCLNNEKDPEGSATAIERRVQGLNVRNPCPSGIGLTILWTGASLESVRADGREQ